MQGAREWSSFSRPGSQRGPEASPAGTDLLSLFVGSKTSGLRALPAFEATDSPNPPRGIPSQEQ